MNKSTNGTGKIILFSLMNLLIFFCASTALATEQAGIISMFEGSVSVYRDGAVRGEKVNSPAVPFQVGDSIRTKRNGRAFITFIDGSKVVLQEESSLHVKGIHDANVDHGTVLFEIKKQGQAKGLNITSATVTMGVRGTRFAVSYKEERVSIFLKTGELEISSLLGEFKRHKDTMEKEFEGLQKKMEQDFKNAQSQMEAYFKEASRQMKEGNFEYVKQFNMLSGSAVSIADSEVVNIPIPDDMEDEFKLLDTF